MGDSESYYLVAPVLLANEVSLQSPAFDIYFGYLVPASGWKMTIILKVLQI